MENQAEFDLNHAIQSWRQYLSRSPSYRAENLEELESHLRDSVTTLERRGLSDEEAFLIATRRVGPSRALEPEFAKVNGKEVWLGRLLWMLLGVQTWGLFNSVSGAIGRTGSQFLVSLMPDRGVGLGDIGQVLYGRAVPAIPAALFFFADLTVLALVIAGGWWLIRRSESRLAQMLRRRGWLVLGGVILCLVLFGGSVLNWVGSARMARTADPSTYGEILMSMTVASMALFLLKTVALAVLTVLLARRQLRWVAA